MDEDEFFTGLEGLLRDTARRSHVSRFDGAPMHQVDLVVELRQVVRVLSDHCQRVLVAGEGKWLEVADMLDAAARACRNEADVPGCGSLEG